MTLKTSEYSFSKRSRDSLFGVHTDLVIITTAALAICEIDFVVTEGLRSKDRQRKLVESGASQTMRSRHLTGHAVDLAAFVDGGIRWDWPLYEELADAMKRAASLHGIPLEWGGDWKFRDGPHFQLTWADYPV